jgi:hypothetical protein
MIRLPRSPFDELAVLDGVAVDVPVDAAPWVVTNPCDAPPRICTFVPESGGGAATIAAEVTSSTCTESDMVVSYLELPSPMPSGEGYQVRCDTDYVVWPRRFRVGEEEFAAPTLVHAAVHREFSEGCCDKHLLAISAQIEGQTLEDFGAQGGLIRVDLENEGTWFAPPDSLELWRFPDSEGDVTVTALSVEGEALGSLRVSPQDFSRDRVYIPCAVDLPGRPSLLMWLLAPVRLASPFAAPLGRSAVNAGRIASTARDPGRLRRWARAISALLLVSPSAVQAARAEPVEPPAAPDTRARPRLVLTSGYGLTFGVSPRPSLDAALLVGGSVSARWAIGYQGTLSLGWAERYVLGLITTRHHIAAVRGATSGKTLASVGRRGCLAPALPARRARGGRPDRSSATGQQRGSELRRARLARARRLAFSRAGDPADASTRALDRVHTTREVSSPSTAGSVGALPVMPLVKYETA